MKRSQKDRIRKSQLWRKRFNRKLEPNFHLTIFMNLKGGNNEMPIKFDDIKGYDEKDFLLPMLQAEFINKKILIEAVRFGEGQFGEYAVVTVKGEEYRTSATVLCKHLHKVQEAIEAMNDTVEVTIKKEKNYYKFE